MQTVRPDGERHRCSELWGGNCKAWVGPPDWNHGTHPSAQARVKGAADVNCPPAILQRLSHDSEIMVLASVAGNPSSPISTLRRLSYHDDFYVYYNLARNLSSPPEILEHLSRHNNATVRFWVASNPSCPPAALEILLLDPQGSTRQRAADHQNLPAHIRAMWQLTH
jgi:hypothetical protein